MRDYMRELDQARGRVQSAALAAAASQIYSENHDSSWEIVNDHELREEILDDALDNFVKLYNECYPNQ